MSPPELKLPIIDFTPYLNPTCQEDKDRVVAEVAQACAEFGFFQVRGHGIALELQKRFLNAMGNFFNQPMEKKLELSFLKNPNRRGYEGSGMSMRDGDALPDSKEAFFINREEPVFEPPGFHGPNVWPELPEDQFKEPVWEYYKETNRLGRMIWEMFILGLGESVDVLDKFASRPLVPMKMIRYPPTSKTLEGQFGVGAHTDFGGITVLLQQPGEEGLEVWVDQVQQWLPVPSIEDVYIINAGNMVQRWSGNRYKSAKHRVIIKHDRERLSCATFYHGDWQATNPFDPTDKVSVGEMLFGRFKKQFSFPEEAEKQTIDMAAAAGAQKDVKVEA